MKLEERLRALFGAIADEAARNAQFARRLAAALEPDSVIGPAQRVAEQRKGKRSPAIVDPIALFRESPALLRSRLEELDLEQLRDVLSDYGMDPGRLVAKWKKKERVIEHIAQMATQRARKGDAFSSNIWRGEYIENEDILRRLGFIEIPKRMLWISHDRRMAFSNDVVRDCDSQVLNDHLREDVPKTDFMFHFTTAPEDINKACGEILNEIGLPTLRPHVRVTTLRVGR